MERVRDAVLDRMTHRERSVLYDKNTHTPMNLEENIHSGKLFLGCFLFPLYKYCSIQFPEKQWWQMNTINDKLK
jgi:hypothetical protein